jgi:uncharacterized membrane protein YqgA involved in biofilm formation
VIPGTGTALNCATVLVGGTLGLAAGERIPLALRENLVAGLGLFTLAYGLKTAVLPSVNGIAPDFAIVLVALLLGTAIGSLLRIDSGITRFGNWVQRRTGGAAGSSVSRAFVTTSLLFCVGPLTILGSYQDGAQGDILLLAIKAGLDGVAALAFASTLGGGVLLSAVTVLVVQGSLTLLAVLTRGALDVTLVAPALATGGLLLVGIGLGLLEVRRLRVADMLPAVVIAPLVAALVRAWQLPI